MSQHFHHFYHTRRRYKNRWKCRRKGSANIPYNFFQIGPVVLMLRVEKPAMVGGGGSFPVYPILSQNHLVHCIQTRQHLNCGGMIVNDDIFHLFWFFLLLLVLQSNKSIIIACTGLGTENKTFALVKNLFSTRILLFSHSNTDKMKMS